MRRRWRSWKESEPRAGWRRLHVLVAIASISLPISIGAGIIAFVAFRAQIRYQERQLIQTQERRIQSRYDTCELIKGIALHAADQHNHNRVLNYISATPLANCPGYARQYSTKFR